MRVGASARSRSDGAAPSDRSQGQKRVEAQARQRLADARKPLLARQSALEREMSALAEEKDELDAWLASEAAYTEAAKDVSRNGSRGRAKSRGSSRAWKASGSKTPKRWSASRATARADSRPHPACAGLLRALR